MKEHFTTQVTVNGKGATRQQAFAAALSQVQPGLLKENPPGDAAHRAPRGRGA